MDPAARAWENGRPIGQQNYAADGRVYSPRINGA
jgi:hypothetical protein